MTTASTDKVEREITINAPRERVFAALTDPALFPTWGPEKIEGALAAGERPIFDFGPNGGGKVRVLVVAVEPPQRFAFRWMQGVTDSVLLLGDPLKGPNTLVEFLLEENSDGTRVRVVESGLDALPGVPGMDPEMARENMGKGWQLMLGGLARHFTGEAELKDAVEAQVVLKASQEQVYNALVRPEMWWAEKVEGTVAPGQTPLLDFGQFGRWRLFVEAAEPNTRLAYRRVQGVDPSLEAEDPRTQPSTLVEWKLERVPEGTRVHVSERGFEALKGEMVLGSFRRANQAWGIILGILEMHFSKK